MDPEEPLLIVVESDEDVEKIVAWYQPAWLFVQPSLFRGGSVQRIQEMVANPTDAFSAVQAFADGDCAVYRIATSAPASTRGAP